MRCIDALDEINLDTVVNVINDGCQLTASVKLRGEAARKVL